MTPKQERQSLTNKQIQDKIKLFFDTYEFDEEDRAIAHIIEYRALAPIRFYRECTDVRCVFHKNGYCMNGKAQPSEIAGCQLQPTHEDGTPLNQDVPLPVIFRCLLKDYKILEGKFRDVQNKFSKVQDFLKTDAYEGYKGRIAERDAVIKKQAEEIGRLKAKIVELNKQ